MFILDTNVVSELRKASGKADANVIRWRLGVDRAALYLSVITIYELEVGVLLLQRRDARTGLVLKNWMQQSVLQAYAGRILQIDTLIAQRSAALHVPHNRPWADTMIAATALVHDMTVVTRNVGDFQSTGVNVLNPWLA